jgi:hypothetical protein
LQDDEEEVIISPNETQALEEHDGAPDTTLDEFDQPESEYNHTPSLPPTHNRNRSLDSNGEVSSKIQKGSQDQFEDVQYESEKDEGGTSMTASTRLDPNPSIVFAESEPDPR